MSTGIRVNELRLVGGPESERSYGATFRTISPDGGFRPLSIIAGPSLTGKTSIIDFIKYCLGDDEHPQHTEILTAVRSALLETELASHRTTIERSATGAPSKFASIWNGGLSDLARSTEIRVSAEPPSDPDGLSQLVLAACDLNGIELPEAPTKADSATHLLSIRDLFRVMFVPNERLDNKNLAFEQSHFMVRQKFIQTIDVMFGVHDNEAASLGARHSAAQAAARAAAQTAMSLRHVAEADYPRGPIELGEEHSSAEQAITVLSVELDDLDRQQRSSSKASHQMWQRLAESQQRATASRIRVRDRRSLLSRLSALRGQYADDKRKLNFLRDAERLFDPLHIVVCPACLHDLPETPSVKHGCCSLCGQQIEDAVAGKSDMDGEAPAGETPDSDTATAVLDAEIRAVSQRLQSLNEYFERLEIHLKVLVEESLQADDDAAAAAQAVDAIATSPAPWLALRDDLTRRIGELNLTAQAAQAGKNMWNRVGDAEANRDRLLVEAQRIGELRRTAGKRTDRAQIVSALSQRFGEILNEIGYPKLSEPFIDSSLVPHVRGLPYTHASSGGTVLISLAWHLAIWEIAHEMEASAPGLLVLDSPQKNLGHSAVQGDSEFADTTLVNNFYGHVRRWLAADGAGAQLIVIDNSPPDFVADDVVVEFTRDPQQPPYGLITDAID
ncbi:ATP-binding protein [Mycolicibacterium sphagni]|uniref:ATP-binding protein n=1 Tax=Mycolicibacterium sphagni TaxID=1786 RepID=UPI0021F38720|nr:ATP-binding protein [Mycolicibacterium sphagni]MCV7175449.1 DNA recombination protein RecN [Mycolicibacterium sphagni]